MKAYAIKHQPTGKWVVSAELSLEDLDIRCFHTARSARAFIRSVRSDRKKGWWIDRCGMNPNDLIMVEVSVHIDYDSFKRIPLPEDVREAEGSADG